MLKRFIEAKSFRFHIPKPKWVPKITFVDVLKIMTVYAPCMYAVSVLYACIICMSALSYLLRGCSRPPGAKINAKRSLRIQAGRFLKIALKLVLIADSESTRSQLSESGLRSQEDPLGVEP